MDEETYASLPAKLTLREMRGSIGAAGSRVRVLTVMTTLTDPVVWTKDEILNLYGERWNVGVFNRTWKTGCRVEEIQLETQARLKNCLAMYAIVAWRVLYLTYLNRTCPRLPCTVVFEEGEWKPVWLVVAKLPLPKKPPELAEMMRLLTQLGGYNNRSGEPPAGPQPLWIGLRRMADFSLAWQAFGSKQ